MGFWDYFRKQKNSKEDVKETGLKEVETMNTEFVKGILFEENPFENEVPEKVVVFDLEGNRVQV